MTSSTNYSDINVRPRRSRGVRSSKKSILYSDYHADEDSKNGNLGQRSVSLTALPHAGPNSPPPTAPTPTSGTPLEPRMAQLETLEAKMASIEVSLSTTPRRKNGKKNGSGQINLIGKTSTLGSSSAVNILASVRSNALVNTCRELEVLRNALKDKENTIQNLQGQMNCCGRLTSPQPLDASERRAAELRMQTLKQEEEARKTAIKKINLTLEQIDSTESNIDVRIRQAELEYELGREELGLLGVREEMRTLQARLDAKPTPTLYSCVNSSGKGTLHCVQLEYDPKSPRFGAGNLDDKIGLFVQWAAEDSGLQKGDRILEVNGKLTLATSKEEMTRLLTVCPSRAEIVVHRIWNPPPSNEDYLRRENLRLTHRISYLEDQVSELLLQKEKSIPSKLPKFDRKPVEVFQKGSQVTLLSNPEVTKNVNHSTTVTIGSNSAPKVISVSNEVLNENGDAKNNNHQNSSITSNGCTVPVGPSQKYHEVDNYHAYQPKLHNNAEKIKALSRKYEKDEFSSTLTKNKYKNEHEEDDERSKKHLINVQSAKSTLSLENPYSLSDLERSSRKNGQYYSRMIDYSSETSCPRYRSHRDRSVKSLDLDADEEAKIRCKSNRSDVEIMDHNKPTPPKKPIRLSIHRATSLQNVEVGYNNLHNVVRKMKRSHKGEAPQPPGFNEVKVNGNEGGMSESNNSRTSSRAESWITPDSNSSPFRWPGQYHRNKSKSGEKWC